MNGHGEDVWTAYVDGECDDTEREWVEAQIAAATPASEVLAEIRATRDAVRALPMRDAPPEFWERILAEGPSREFDQADDGPDAVVDAHVDASAPIELGERRERHPRRWLAAAGGAVAAAVIAVVVFMPQPKSVTPPVGTFTDAHAVRSSLQDNPISSLAPLAVRGGIGR